MIKKWAKRIGMLALLLFLTIVQVGYLTGTWHWCLIVPLFVILYTTYKKEPKALGIAAVAGFLLEAYSISHTGLIFITMMLTVLSMIILGRTILTDANIFSASVLVAIGTIIFLLGYFGQITLASAFFLRHPVVIYQPWQIALKFLLFVFAVFFLHALFKSIADRFYPKLHARIYGTQI